MTTYRWTARITRGDRTLAETDHPEHSRDAAERWAANALRNIYPHRATPEDVRTTYTRVRPAAVAVDTSQYEASHGRAPRGFGGWWFHVGAGQGGPVLQERGNYGDCKRAAIARAQSLGASVIIVLP